MSGYWKDFWRHHVEGVPADDPFRQVLRVQSKQPLSEELFGKILIHISGQLELRPEHAVLDLCCGNGMVSVVLAQQCQSVVGVDFCEPLISDVRLKGQANLNRVVGDATELSFRAESFHRVLLAAALQHFSQAEVLRLLNRSATWLKPGGILLITDILDSHRIWNFFNSWEREADYFKGILESIPVLGTWFDRVWLEKAARHAGFTDIEALDQPEEFWYAHYRFDFRCRRA